MAQRPPRRGAISPSAVSPTVGGKTVTRGQCPADVQHLTAVAPPRGRPLLRPPTAAGAATPCGRLWQGRNGSGRKNCWGPHFFLENTMFWCRTCQEDKSGIWQSPAEDRSHPGALGATPRRLERG
eukprot:gene13334-biopygen20023